MKMTRRQVCQTAVIVPFGTVLTAQETGPSAAWSAAWDRELILTSTAAMDGAYDSAEMLLKKRIGPDYNYHSLLRNTTGHPTRDSMIYAHMLLEASAVESSPERELRASQVLERMLSLQDQNPDSKWYGIWGYYMEEPPAKMSPADWNWADFIGAEMLLIAFRHGQRLSPTLRGKLSEGIRHAAASVRRRNVSMSYTNIAVQGTFVALGAAQLLNDADLHQYATNRLQRFAATVDEFGSFAEYNSPTYVNVTILNLTRMRMFLREPMVLALTDRIHTRAWMHLAKHWHAPSRQLAGPMSRCYSTDIGRPLWLQKALGGRLAFATLEQSKGVAEAGEVAVHDYRCPEEEAAMFLKLDAPHQHREMFSAPSAAGIPIQGTTWLAADYCVGSANRSDFWIQRRPLVAYWGAGHSAQLRFIKDDYDFSSALFYGTQQKNYVLGQVNFRNPGGDKHTSLDPIKNGAFEASRFRLVFDIAGAPDNAELMQEESRVAINLGGAMLWLRVPAASFGSWPAKLSTARENGHLFVSLDLIPPGQKRVIRWTDVREAFASFCFVMESGGKSLQSFVTTCDRLAYSSVGGKQTWTTPEGTLAMTAGSTVQTQTEQDKAFNEWLNGARVPYLRLSEARLTQPYPAMVWGDTSRLGRPFAKDPSVIKFKGRYLLYYSLPAYGDKRPNDGWAVGIAESKNLVDWHKAGEVLPDLRGSNFESKGLAAPCAKLIDGKVHLFYQTYGNGPNDAICHAVSDDGLVFTRDATNPVFHPTGTWTAGRAIDAEVVRFKNRWFLYAATRDAAMKVQMLTGAVSNGGFERGEWQQIGNGPILRPELPWEQDCIEAPTCLERNGVLYMFYAGAYNNAPQQIGCARSTDGFEWKRVSREPLLRVGDPGTWNSSESGHPGTFVDDDGQGYLFFQGNNDMGKTWLLSFVKIVWNGDMPTLTRL